MAAKVRLASRLPDVPFMHGYEACITLGDIWKGDLERY